MSIRLFIAVMVTMVSFNAYADGSSTGTSGDQPKTADEWFEQCRGVTPGGYLACINYARGLADGLREIEIFGYEHAIVSIPQDVNTDQLKDVGQRYLLNKSAKSRRENTAVASLTNAFHEAWPCK
jgi:hypothetical protein